MKRYSNKIYIDNLGFANRGDQLMIQAVLEQIRSRCLDAQILVRADVFMQNPTYKYIPKIEYEYKGNLIGENLLVSSQDIQYVRKGFFKCISEFICNIFDS